MIVAPNSPSARAKAKSTPARSPRRASGTVMVQKTRHGEAPRVRAICSRRGLVSSNATRAARTSSGNDMTPSAMATARQVKTTSMPRCACSQPPMGPRRPRIFRRMRPVAIGGMTSGSATSVSTRDLPNQSRRASSHARAIPGGTMARVLSAETHAVKPTSCQSSPFISDYGSTMKPNFSNTRAALGLARCWRNLRAASGSGASLSSATG